jgi:hypothetical protein
VGSRGSVTRHPRPFAGHGAEISFVTTGHSRSKNGVAPLAFVPAIHVFEPSKFKEGVDARHKAGHDG